jgi:uncharacterized protein (DUF1330 family)
MAFALVVVLKLHPGQSDAFERYEEHAFRIMKRYGGKLEHRVRCGQVEAPDEVHVVSFPDEEAFERYRVDPELAALRELRTACISETTLWRGEKIADFAAGGRATPSNS